MAPTFVASRTALPPEGANFPWGGPAENCMAPMFVASRTALPPGWAELRLGRPGASFD